MFSVFFNFFSIKLNNSQSKMILNTRFKNKAYINCILFYKSVRIKTILFYTLPTYWFITGSIFLKKFDKEKISSIRLTSYMSKWFCCFFGINSDYIYRSNLNSFFTPNNSVAYRFLKNVYFIKNRKYRRIKKWLYKSRLKANLSNLDILLSVKNF